MSRFKDAKIDIVGDETLSRGWSHLRKVTFDYTGSTGKTVQLSWEVFDRGKAAAILLYDRKRDTVVLVRQFRITAYLEGEAGFLLEVPAGSLEDEDPAAGIAREVFEETGYRLRDLKPVYNAIMSPGAVTERVWLFVALIDAEDRVAEGGGLADEHEDIEVLEIPLDDAFAMVASGEIYDAKTIMLLQWAMLNRERLASVDF